MAIFKNSAPIVTNGLILYLDAANPQSYTSGSSIYNDISGNNNSGSLISTSYSTANGGNIIYNSTSSVITYPSITFTNQPYTLEFCGRIEGPIDSSNRRSLFLNPTYAGELTNVSTYFTNFICDSVPLYFNFGMSRPVPTGSLYFHWVCTVDSSKILTIYLNNNVVHNTSILTTYSTISCTFTRFGNWSGNSRVYSGSLGYIRIYNKALSQAEVTQNYNVMKSRFNLN